MKKEARARIKINKLLEESGWRFFDTEEGRANIELEAGTTLTRTGFNALGDDFEKTEKGYIDFLLLDKNSYPVALLEAKREGIDPLIAKEQARIYAISQNIRFVIMSNGNLHYFWDIETGNPEIITSFPSQESLGHRREFKPDITAFSKEPVETDYIVLTQKYNYKTDPKWLNSSQRNSFIQENKLRFLRDYQLNAVHSIQKTAGESKTRFLLEMATGTGKTLVSAAIIKLFLRTGNAKRVLFLVDRLELEEQAERNMVTYLKNDYRTVIYKENRDNWKRAEIVITTVQSLLFNNKYMNLFSPTDFDLVISDEAHRSISGNSRAVFEYFVGYKLGLTATPKNYLKKVDIEKLAEKDPRKLEQRQMLDTYETFGCQSGEPTFQYSLIDGVNDGYLVNPFVIDARTDITTEMLSKEGYSVMVEDEDGNLQEEIYYHKDFEKKFFSDETNLTFCKTFIENALRDPLSTEIGKTIIFCVTRKHASKITQTLNILANKYFPNKYQSDFAVQITSDIPNAQQMTTNFSNNNLNGRTKFINGYLTSRTRVCVTVGMMTTGYDCEDILNLCLLRPIFSPSNFVQIKGRGTRPYTFIYKERDEAGRTEEHIKEKKNFKLFDFFANCKYFEEDFNYDQELKLPAIYKPPTEPTNVTTIKYISKNYTNLNLDPIKSIKRTPVGQEGMKIDRKLFEKFTGVVKKDEYIRTRIDEGRYEEAEEYIREKVFDKPEDYFDLNKLRKSVKVDRRISLREILDKIFGRIKEFKTKEDLLEEEVQKFISIYKPEPKFVNIISHFIKAYILDDSIRKIMDTGEYAELATNPRFNMKDLKELDVWRQPVVEYIKDYVSLNTFLQ